MSPAFPKSSWLTPATRKDVHTLDLEPRAGEQDDGALAVPYRDPGLGVAYPDPVRGNDATDMHEQPILDGTPCREHDDGVPALSRPNFSRTMARPANSAGKAYAQHQFPTTNIRVRI